MPRSALPCLLSLVLGPWMALALPGPSKGTPHIPKLDISKIKSHLDKMKGAEGMAKPEAASMRLPKFEPGKINVEEDAKKAEPLAYTLEKFAEVYGGDRHGQAPDGRPVHTPGHKLFDPFEIPMPTLKAEYTAEAAFAKMDEDKNGRIEGPEFRGVSESGMFNVLAPDQFQRYAIFGMGQDLWIEMHKDEMEAAGHSPEDLFDLHDADSNERLSRDEYAAAVQAFRGEL